MAGLKVPAICRFHHIACNWWAPYYLTRGDAMNNKGFTLVELTLAIGIVGLIVAGYFIFG